MSRLLSPLRRSSLGIKLAALGAVVTAAVVTVAFLGLGVEIRKETRQSFAAELSRNQRTLQQLEAYDASQLLFAASLITETPSLQYDLSIYRVEANAGGRARTDLVNTMERELRERLHSVGNDLLIVTDDSGRVFASAATAGAAIPRGTSLSGLAAVRHVLDANAPSDSGALGVLQTDAGHFQVAAYPLVQAGITLGSLVLGRRLDSAFVAAARAASDAAIIVTAGPSVVATSDPGLNSVVTVESLAARAADSGAVMVPIAGEDFVAASVPFGETEHGEPVRLWLLQPLSRRVAELTAPLRRQFVLIGALAVLVAMIGAALVAGTVLDPFQRFVRYMRSGAAMEERQGGFDAEQEAAELRTLNDSFNQLMDSLAAKRRQLEERTAELLAANVVLTDEISERAKVEQALRESQAQLRQSQKLEAIGTLAGGIAHDFNNLITVITGYTQLALMRADPSTPEAADLRQVVEASDRAATLTHQLLAFSRKQVLQPTVLDLADVAQGIAPMLQRIIGEHIELRLATSGPLARVRADRGQLEQVLLNLAVNARDAMPEGGLLTIVTSNVPDERAPASRAVWLVVSDTGIGMTDEIRERIFEPFFTTKELGKGTGLGLSTVYGIVNQSGGTIAVESVSGRGTTFTITLPAAETMGDGATRSSEDGELPSGSETVLIVEDADDVRILARRTLEERGYTVFVARNADEALEIASARHVDVLLADIVMPQTSGPQLVARYQSLHKAPLVVYMSGYADDALTQYELDPNVVFLRKPFTPASLARTVRDALDHSHRDASMSRTSVSRTAASAAD
ncbi:MAG TPA: ATP-binding protein [Gemmatimonadaceae bacterium]|nr:ATP-binding protein [Gemmatimonadaceae bacterium]